MANKTAKTLKPLPSNVKGLICLVVLCIITVFVSCLSLGGMNLDAQGVNVLLPWVPVSSANWPASLPLDTTLGGGTYADYTYTLEDDAPATAVADSIKTIKARMVQLGESDVKVSENGDAIRIETRKMDTSRLTSLLSFVVTGGQYVFTDTNSGDLLTEKDIARAEVNVKYNSTRTSYTVYLIFTVNKDGKAKLAEANPSYLAVTCDGETVSSFATISGDKISATMGYDSSAYNTAANLAFLLNYGAVEATLARAYDGDVPASAGSVLSIVVLVSALLLLCTLAYLVFIGKLTGVAGFLSVWCAVVLGLFFVATIVVPSTYMLNAGCMMAILLGILLPMFAAYTRTEAIGRQISEGAAPRQAVKLGIRSAAKVVWIAHGGVIALSMLLMIFSFSRSTGYTLAAMAVGSAMTTLVMRLFLGCFTMMTNKPVLFGNAK